jgi:hypothetical protein
VSDGASNRRKPSPIHGDSFLFLCLHCLMAAGFLKPIMDKVSFYKRPSTLLLSVVIQALGLMGFSYKLNPALGSVSEVL